MFKAKARRGANGVPTRATSHCSVVIVRTLAIEKDTVPAVSLLTSLSAADDYEKCYNRVNVTNDRFTSYDP